MPNCALGLSLVRAQPRLSSRLRRPAWRRAAAPCSFDPEIRLIPQLNRPLPARVSADRVLGLSTAVSAMLTDRWVWSAPGNRQQAARCWWSAPSSANLFAWPSGLIVLDEEHEQLLQAGGSDALLSNAKDGGLGAEPRQRPGKAAARAAATWPSIELAALPAGPGDVNPRPGCCGLPE